MHFSSLLMALAVSAVAHAASGTTAKAKPTTSAVAAPIAYASVPAGYVYPAQCTSILYAPALTITDLTVSTYCPICDAAKATGGVYTTTYETVYKSLCPTGLVDRTYTVTQSCTGTTPINYATPAPGFEVVTVTCNTCGSGSTYAITQPSAKTQATATPASGPAAGPYVATGGKVYPTGSTPYVQVQGNSASAVGVASAFICTLSVFLGMLLL